MNQQHEVISAFLDDQPFDPQTLVDALTEPAGRTLLIDLIALRQIVQPAESVPVMTLPPSASRGPWRVIAAAAALFIALAGGYVLGGHRASTADDAAPAPTRVVQAELFAPPGGHP